MATPAPRRRSSAASAASARATQAAKTTASSSAAKPAATKSDAAASSATVDVTPVASSKPTTTTRRSTTARASATRASTSRSSNRGGSGASGSGGASKAVNYALNSLDIKTSLVSRSPSKSVISYQQLSKEILEEHTVIVNTTPLGTHPKVEEYPPLPVDYIGSRHLLFDLIYNPEQTALMKLAAARGAMVLNGEKMLEFQALKAWEIWNQD